MRCEKVACRASDLLHSWRERADSGLRCGPRKLAKVLNLCQDRMEQSKKDRAAEKGDANPPDEHKPSEAEPEAKHDQYGEVEDGEYLEKFNGPPSVSALNPQPKKVSRSPGSSHPSQSDNKRDGREKAKTVTSRSPNPETRKTTSFPKPKTLSHLSQNLSYWHEGLPKLPLPSEARPTRLTFMGYAWMTTRSTYACS